MFLNVCFSVHEDFFLLTLNLCHSPYHTELYKKWGLVFFETTLEGACYNFQIPEEQLPMLTSKF